MLHINTYLFSEFVLLQQTRKTNQTIAHTSSTTGINVGGMPKSERNRGGSVPVGYSAEAIMQVEFKRIYQRELSLGIYP